MSINPRIIKTQLPSSIPLYINVKPQLKLNGVVVQELGETSLGKEYTLKQTLYTPSRTITFGQPRLLMAGGYYAVNTIAQSISVEKLKQLQSKIKKTQETLQGSNQTAIKSLNREDVMGDMVYAASLSYYAQMIAQGKMATRPLKAFFELVGSSGIIGYKPKVNKLFGMPINLQAGGMNCDLIDTHMVEQSSNNQKKHIQANQQLGMIGSSLEHQVLEQLFATDTQAEGFSAVKAIQLANAQGQKIFTVTQDNYETVIPQLQLAPAAIADIRAAAMAGLTVTTHEKRVHVNGYTGEGYIVLNDRGTGAYMINGGLYGGIYVNQEFRWTLFALSVGTINDSRPDVNRLDTIEKTLFNIAGSFLVILSVTYPDGVKIEPFAGFSAQNLFAAKFQTGLADLLNHFAVGLTTIGTAFGAIDGITNYLVIWYFFGEGKAVDLKDVYDAGTKYENAVSKEVKIFRLRNKQCNTTVIKNISKCVTWTNGLFALGCGFLHATSQCNDSTCDYHFSIDDMFEDALDLGIDDIDGNQEAYGATPYPIHYDFQGESLPCK